VLAPRRFPQIYLPLIGIAIAALWPVTAYALNPLLLPALIVVGVAVLVGVRWPEYALAIAIALAPMARATLSQPPSVGVTLPANPLKYLVPILILSVLFYSMLIRGLDRRPLPAVAIGVALMVGSVLLSGFQALDPGRAVSFLLIIGAALFVAVVNTVRTRKQLLVVLAGVLAGLLISSLQGVIQHQIGDFTFQFATSSPGAPVGRVQAAFGQPDDYGGFLAILIPVALAVTFAGSLPRWLRVLAVASAAAAIPALVFSYSRWSMVACVVGSLLWLLLVRPKVALIGAVALAVIALVFAPANLRDRFQSTSGGTLAIRQDVNKGALDIYAAHPILGVGVNNFQIAYAEQWAGQSATQRRLFHTGQLLVPTAAPNEFLNTLTEQGLVGLLALLVFIVLAIRTAWGASRAAHPAVRAIGVAVGMAVGATLVNSYSSISLQDVPVDMLFVLLALAAIGPGVFSDPKAA
jgi:O-antigen ligase